MRLPAAAANSIRWRLFLHSQRRAPPQYAVVKDAATPAELKVARSMLWKELGEKYGWLEDKPETWTDEAYKVGGDPRSGLIDMVHSDTFWCASSLCSSVRGF